MTQDRRCRCGHALSLHYDGKCGATISGKESCSCNAYLPRTVFGSAHSKEAERLAREFFFDAQQTQSCLDLLAPSEDVYDLESTGKVLTFAAEHGISPVELAGFVSRLIARRMPLRPPPKLKLPAWPPRQAEFSAGACSWYEELRKLRKRLLK